jgi:hypothetical protein
MVAPDQLDELKLIMSESWIVPRTHQPFLGAGTPNQTMLYPIDRQHIVHLGPCLINRCPMVTKVQLALALGPSQQKPNSRDLTDPREAYQLEMFKVFDALGHLQYLTDLSIFVGGMTLIPSDFAGE